MILLNMRMMVNFSYHLYLFSIFFSQFHFLTLEFIKFQFMLNRSLLESEDPEYIVSEDNDFINCVDNDEIRMDKETEITRIS